MSEPPSTPTRSERRWDVFKAVAMLGFGIKLCTTSVGTNHPILLGIAMVGAVIYLLATIAAL